MTDLATFLGTVTAFDALDPAERTAVAGRCLERTVAAGARLLTQGTGNSTLYVLRAGQVAVRTRQNGRVETIAHLNPPSIIGEVSFLTGRPCSADVEVLVDADVIELPLEALAPLSGPHERIVRALAGVLAHRLHGVVTGENAPVPSPVVLVRAAPHWAAPRAFTHALTMALSEGRRGDALLVHVGAGNGAPTAMPGVPGLAVASIGNGQTAGGARGEAAARLPEWTARFGSVVLAAADQVAPEGLETLAPFATHTCTLIGPGDPAPDPQTQNAFVAQDARTTTLPELDGSRRLVVDVQDAEIAYAAGRSLPPRFRDAVQSIARGILGQQVAVALGAGGARGWCHVGILDTLSAAGLPIDLIAGTSMGSVVGGLWAIGRRGDALQAAADEWRSRRRRLREWRLWRMHMASAHQVDALFGRYFGERTLNSTELPFWAVATDIERGEPVTLKRGLLRRAACASTAFPGWTPPVTLEGRVLVDGAVMDPVPARAAREMGAAFVVSVLAIGPFAPHPLAARFPSRTYDLFARSMHLSGVALGLSSNDVAGDVVIAPDLGDATMLSWDRDRELIAAGARAAEAQLPAILTAYEERIRATRVGSR